MKRAKYLRELDKNERRYQEGLITEPEYRARKNELMDMHFGNRYTLTRR